MSRTILVITFVGIIASALLGNFFVSEPAQTSAPVQVDADLLPEETRRRILQASVQITMLRDEVVETQGASSEGEPAPVTRQQISIVNCGIGTLVKVNGEVVIVTHNHWPHVVDASKPDRVQFRDDQGKLLLEIDGAAFQGNILYRDGGTLVMQAPAALLNKVAPVDQIDDSEQVAPGDVVYVVRQQPTSEATVGLLAAQVTAVEDDGQHAVLALRSADGQTIVPGDSGGGIWSNGVLVGNMWMTIQEQWQVDDSPESVETVTTDRSRAAGLTESLLNRLGQSLDNLQESVTVEAGIAMQ